MRTIDFSSWQTTLLTLFGLALVTAIGVGIRLVTMMTIQQRRERINRQINERLRTLIAAYKGEWSMFWLYTRAFIAYRDGKGGAKATQALLRDAAEANPYVPGILSGAAPAVASRDGYVTMGGADEAAWYVEACGPAWRTTPGAIAWLNEHATRHERSTTGWGIDIQ